MFSLKQTLSLLMSACLLSGAALANPFAGNFTPGYELDYLYDGTAGYSNPE